MATPIPAENADRPVAILPVEITTILPGADAKVLGAERIPSPTNDARPPTRPGNREISPADPASKRNGKLDQQSSGLYI